MRVFIPDSAPPALPTGDSEPDLTGLPNRKELSFPRRFRRTSLRPLSPRPPKRNRKFDPVTDDRRTYTAKFQDSGVGRRRQIAIDTAKAPRCAAMSSCRMRGCKSFRVCELRVEIEIGRRIFDVLWKRCASRFGGPGLRAIGMRLGLTRDKGSILHFQANRWFLRCRAGDRGGRQ